MGLLTTVERIWKRVDNFGGSEECWAWMGYCDDEGYDRFSSREYGQAQLAHRLMWLLIYGAIPEGLDVLHKCDNPYCVNYNHLYLGTQADNNKDKKNKGRCAAQKGELNPMAVMTKQDIRYLRKLYMIGYSPRQVAEEMQLNRSTVRNVIDGKTWMHVGGMEPLFDG